MGIWDSVFGNTKKDNGSERITVNWAELTGSDSLKSLIEASYTRPQLIFKHSMTCGVSGMAKRRFEADAGSFAGRYGFHLLIIQKNRELSGQIASELQVRHESPQLLIVKDGVVAAHASHWQIDSLDLGQYE